MNPYEILKARLADRIYKRGMYKGDAPMESRGKREFRIVAGTGYFADRMHVRMYSTNTLTAYANGEYTIDLNGYGSSSTTRTNINYSLAVVRQHVSISNRNVMGISQATIYADGGRFLYYDGIRFNQEGKLLSEPKAFEARRIDKAQSKAFTDGLKASGFKDMFPVLYATSQLPDSGTSLDRHWDDDLQDSEYAHRWPETIEYFKYTHTYSYTKGTRVFVEIDNAKGCWTRMMAKAKQNMYQTIRTEVTRVEQNKYK
jgi:hypothetical protein